MGKKTIYVADAELWDRARTLAGPDGMSSFLGEALRAYVGQKERERQGFARHRLSCGGELVQFDGRLLASAVVKKHRVTVNVYLTKSKSLFATVTADGEEEIEHRCTHDSIKGIRDFVREAFPGGLGPKAEAAFLRELKNNLGPDWVIHIE